MENKRITALPLALALTSFVGCTTPEANEQEAAVEAAEAPSTALQHTSNEFLTEARGVVDELGAKLDELDARYAYASGEAAAQWEVSRAELARNRQDLERALVRMRDAGAADAATLQADLSDELGRFTERVERESLAALDAPEFVAAARTRLGELDESIRALEPESETQQAASEDVTMAMQELSAQSDTLHTRLAELADAAAERVADERSDLTDDIASLSASVRLHGFSLRYGLATD